MNNPAGLKRDHISGIDNDCADKMSRVYSKVNSPSFFLILVLGIPFAEGMEALPSESRVALGPLLSIVGGTFSRTKSQKEYMILHSR